MAVNYHLDKISHQLNFWQRLTTGRETVYVIDNLAMLIGSGMDAESAVISISKQIKSAPLRRSLEYVRDGLDDGWPLWRALSGIGLFPTNGIDLIRLGEQSGRLTDNLKLLAGQQAKERSFRGKVRSAMLYPTFILLMTIIIGLALAWFILPRLAPVFTNLKVKLPWSTKLILGFGNFLHHYGNIFVPLVLLIIIGLIVLFTSSPKLRQNVQWIFSHIPGISGLIQEVEISRLGFLLGSLLEAGIPINEAMEALLQTSEDRDYVKLYRHINSQIEDGSSIAHSLDSWPNSKKLVPIPVQNLIATAERAGHLSATLQQIGQMYEERTENSAKNLATIIEPLMLVIVWLGVLLVAVSVILPIYQLIGQFNPN